MEISKNIKISKSSRNIENFYKTSKSWESIDIPPTLFKYNAEMRWYKNVRIIYTGIIERWNGMHLIKR